MAALRRRLLGSLDRMAERAGARRREERHDSAAALGTEVERDLRRHAVRRRFLRGLALVTLGGAAGGIGGFLAAAGL